MSEQALVPVALSSRRGLGLQTALHRASMVGNSEAVCALIQGGCAVDLQDRVSSEHTPLWTVVHAPTVCFSGELSVQHTHCALVLCFVEECNTALHEASWHGFSQCVKQLVKAGADVHVRNKTGNTALHLTCQNAHAQTARLLLLGGANPDTKNNMGDTCLHVAARYNNLSLVKILLSSLCSLTEKNQVGDTALHVAAALNHKKTVQLLLEAGTDGNIKNNAGRTALDKARDNNHKDVALLLARAPQVHRYLRGRTIRKQRERVKSEHRSLSVNREEILSNKHLLYIGPEFHTVPQAVRGEQGSSSIAEEGPSVERTGSSALIQAGLQHHHHRHHHHQQHQYQHQYQQQQQHYLKKPTTIHNHHNHHRSRRTKEQEENDFDLRKCKKDTHARKKNVLFEEDEELSLENGRTYQLYTLYRDKDGNIRQAPASGCHCTPLIRRLEGQLKATQEEMRLHILNVQEQVNSRLGQMDRRNRHQIKVLDMLNQERAAAERRNMIYRLEQQAAQGRQEVLMTQAALSRDLQRLCLSQLKDTDVHTAAKGQYCKLLPSPSVEQCGMADADPESLPLLSVVSGDSSTSLATYVNVLSSKSTYSLGVSECQETGSRTYFEMKVDRSPDDYENTALFPLPASGVLLTSADSQWRPPLMQDGQHRAAVVTACGDVFSSSSSSMSSISDRGPQWTGPKPNSSKRRKHFQELMSTGKHSDLQKTTTLEFFVDRPTEPTFSQERNNLHAVEVTQRFFETVSAQLELWYERKILEVEKQMEVQAQKDRKELLQRIHTLEEELQKLKTNQDADS
ncbi:ankyrin repeat domain-containing protein 6 isoform X2 [Sphaeramia orbicularis]|uniref:ankyrin repeat domain-containing protein 6 isoform X2 n=1 Tax=Sphaeramia orbicularis TaxID=375764 RepID=UPI0011815917|nr:ankyrin repeat domain-containing protein 6-like isoform X2 [Sphaeramia orbicularis]